MGLSVCEFPRGYVGKIDDGETEFEARPLGGPVEHCGIADDQEIGSGLDFLIGQGPDGDLRPDAGRIAHRYDDGLFT